jgi:hypothetical protein
MLPQTELVIALSRTPVGDDARKRVRQLLGDDIDWNAVLALAAAWQVEATVLDNLRSDFAAAIREPLLTEIARLEQCARAFALSRTLVLMDLVKSLTRAGIPTIVLKGPAVAMAAYGDFSRRAFGDIDLLVRRGDLPSARDHVIARGYVAHYRPEMENGLIAGGHALEFSGSRTPVELHWSLISRHLNFDLGIDELWSGAHPIRCADSDMMVLAPEYLFLYLCAHGAKHEWASFRWICDIAQLAQRLSSTEAARVMDLAERSNARRILALALRLVRETFGEEYSPFPLEAFLPEGDTAALVALVRARLHPDDVVARPLVPARLAAIHPYFAPLVFWIRSRERTRDQLVCAARFLFIPAASDANGGSLSWMRRPIRLVAQALRRLVHAS